MNISQTPKHKTFISFHHDDEKYKEMLENQWGEQFDGFVSRSVSDGDINPDLRTETIRQKIRDNFISDATVTVVLIGQGTWRRKYVDWEISASLRETENNPRTGLLGILLPTYSLNPSLKLSDTEDGAQYNPQTIPPRLHDNIECGFAKIYSWPKTRNHIRYWIHEAFLQRKKGQPINRRDNFSKNRSENNHYWRD